MQGMVRQPNEWINFCGKLWGEQQFCISRGRATSCQILLDFTSFFSRRKCNEGIGNYALHVVKIVGNGFEAYL